MSAISCQTGCYPLDGGLATENPPPPRELRLAVESSPIDGQATRRFILTLPADGKPASLDLITTPTPGPRWSRHLPSEPPRAAGVRVQILRPPAGDRSKPRVLLVRDPAARPFVSVAGLVANPPVAVLQERDALVLDHGARGGLWNLHVVAFRRPVGTPTAEEGRAVCHGCFEVIGPARVYRCECGACLHYPAAAVPPSGETRGPTACGGLTRCPACDRPVSGEAEGYTWLPEGFTAEEALWALEEVLP